MKKLKIMLIMLLLNFSFTTIVFASNHDLSEKILQEINSYRTKQGLSPLHMEPFISALAEKHSQDMARNLVPFGHDGFGNRIRYLFSHFNNMNGGAENVAYVYTNAKEAVPLWINSAGHRKNIEGDFNLTGIGIAYGDYGRIYLTQIFIRRNHVQMKEIKE